MRESLDTYQDALAIYKQVKVFCLLPEPFTIEKGEVTQNLKLKRSVIIEHYEDSITRMYKENE